MWRIATSRRLTGISVGLPESSSHVAAVGDIRCLLILHGKGERSTPRALLKSHVSAWLPQLPAVMAMHSAERRHGGSGALYVLLRKSERKKAENRERHQKRLG